MNSPNKKLENFPSQIISRESVYVIIPVHNRKATTLKCLAHLKNCGDLKRYYIIVIDDGSTDGTKEAIKKLYPEVIILDGDGDLWWTGATAKGMEYAYQQGAEYFVWLNDDCLPAANTIKEMVAFMHSNPNTLVAPSCYAEESQFKQIQHNGFQARKSCAAKPGEIINVDGMSGWCVGIPSAVYRKIGGPNATKFPHYSGDDIYTLQATKAGFKAYLIGDLKATLFGPVHAKLNFQDYFRSGLSPVTTFKSLFLYKKSTYRLLTRLFVFQERYGLLIGSSIFMIKSSIWVIKWLYIEFHIELNMRFKRLLIRN